MTRCDFNKVAVSVMDVFWDLAFMSLPETSKDILLTSKM